MPRRGSAGFWPRKRASTETVRFRAYTSKVFSRPMLAGFTGYKCGMLHLMMVDDHPNRPTTGQEIFVPGTVIETPPLMVIGLIPYYRTPYGLKQATKLIYITLKGHENKDIEKFVKNDLPKKLRLIGKDKKMEVFTNIFHGEKPNSEMFQRLLKAAKEIHEVRVLATSIPRIAGIHKKKPEIIEIPIIGGEVQERLAYGMNLMSRLIYVTDVFTEGEFIDVTAVTKGKGFQGSVKRHGVMLLPHKAGKKRRGVASMGVWHPPLVRWTVPQPGQLGYHRRTEYNKRILIIGDDPREINPKSGFKFYGIVKTNYVVVKGSIPGPPKRFILLRHAIRSPRWIFKGEEISKPRITFISTVGGG